MTYTRIISSGSALPAKRLSNTDLEKMVDTSDQWIVERTGIQNRYVVVDETSTLLAVNAAKDALKKAEISVQEIELVVVATCTPDQWMPSTACMLQDALGMTSAAAFDLNAACSGFIYALSVVDQYIRNGVYKTALVVGCDVLSRVIDWTDRSTCILFGDGAGAVVLQADQRPGILSTHLGADGCQQKLLYMDPFFTSKKPVVKMQGNKVFRLAVKKLEQLVAETLSYNRLKSDDLDWLVPHQANLRIIKATANKLGLPMSRVVQTVQKHGNTSAASVPLALDCALADGRIKRGQLVLLEVFGAGLTWGSALMRY